MQLVDWRVATATATTLVPPGPRLPLEQAVATVEDLRRLAAEADRHVRSFTLLDPSGDASAVVVVDRPGWIRSNVEGFRTLLDPMLETLAAGRKATLGPVVGAIGPRATGAGSEPFWRTSPPASSDSSSCSAPPPTKAVKPAGSRSSLPTSCPPSRPSASTRTTSACGCACTR